jgi:hypothetical protein
MLAGGAGMIITLLVAHGVLSEIPEGARLGMVLLFLAMMGLFALVAWAGVLLSMRSPWGPTVATVLQLLQVPTVRVGSWLWTFYAGGYLVPYWQSEHTIGYVFGVRASFALSWGGAEEPTIIGINLIPFVILWLLRRKLPLTEALQLSSDGKKEVVVDSALSPS